MLYSLYRTAVWLPTYISQGSAAIDLRGGGNFNLRFLRRYFLSLTAKKNMKIDVLLPKLSQKIKVAYFFPRHSVLCFPNGGRNRRHVLIAPIDGQVAKLCWPIYIYIAEWNG